MPWFLDGSPEITADGPTVRCTGTGGSPFHALWQDGPGLTSGEAYWRVQFQNTPGGGLGVSTASMLNHGYRMKGIHLNSVGNLATCGALLVGSFSPQFKDNAVVGILVSFQGDRLKLYFDLDGAPLGLGFDVPASAFRGQPVLPWVSFHGAGNATITSAPVPALESRVRPPPRFTGLEGGWALQSLREGGAPATVPEIPGFPPVTLEFRAAGGAAPGAYRGHLNVVNQGNFTLVNVGGQWQGSGMASTMMMGPPELMQLEAKLSDLCAAPEDVQVAGQALTLRKGALEAAWQRHDNTPGPFVGNPLE